MSAMPRVPGKRGFSWQALVLILVVTAGVYAPSLDHELQYDAKIKIVGNPNLQEPSVYLNAFSQGRYSEEAARLLPHLTLVLDHHVSGTRPFGYHLTNLILHLVNVVLLALLGRQILARLGYQRSFIPALAAVIFALHPLNSEAVVYCNARPNLLVTTFYLLALITFMRAMEQPQRPSLQIRRWLCFAGAVACALLSKELAVTIVLMAPLLVFWFEEKNLQRRQWLVSRLGLALAALALIAGTVILLTRAHTEVALMVMQVGGQQTGSWGLTLVLSMLGQAEVLMRYLGLALLPRPGFLNVDHGHPHLYQQLFGNGAEPASPLTVLVIPILCAVVIVLLVVAAIRLRHRAPFATFFMLWPLICHAPTSLVPRAEALVEYRTYLPMAGICLLLAWFIERVVYRYALRRRIDLQPLLATGLLMIILLAAGTVVRTRTWATEISLWQDSVAKAPRNSRAHNNLGVALFERGEIEAAISCYWQAVAIRDDYADAYNNLGRALVARGKVELAAMAFYRALDRNPHLAGAHNNLGNLLSQQGRFEEAEHHYRRALESNATLAEVHYNLGMVLVARDSLEDAADHYREALRINPRSAKAHNNLGHVLAITGRVEEAMQHFERAVQLRPNFAEAYNNLGNTLVVTGDIEAAIRHYRQALQIAPRYAEAHHNLGNALLDQGRAHQAIAEYRRALEISPDSDAVRMKLSQALALSDSGS
jgi:tetratricopeptide (TPR) repeat protein